MGKLDVTERVRERAYEIWESEGRPHGLAQVRWQHAESGICGALNGPRSAETPAKPITNPAPKGSASPSKSTKKQLLKKAKEVSILSVWKNPQRWVIAVFATGLVCVMAPAAWAAGNIANGRAIAREQCSNCHVVDKYRPNAQESQPIGPDFMAIKGVTAATLKSRLNKPHPVMSEFPALNDQQIDDLVAYIAWVKD